MDKQDQISPGKSIYEAGSGEVFWKNFLAGFGRALGGMFVYLILLVIVYFLFMTYVMPKLTPFLTIMANLSNSLQNLQKLNTGGGINIPNLQNLFGK